MGRGLLEPGRKHSSPRNQLDERPAEPSRNARKPEPAEEQRRRLARQEPSWLDSWNLPDRFAGSVGRELELLRVLRACNQLRLPVSGVRVGKRGDASATDPR